MKRVFCSGYKPKNYENQESDLHLSYLHEELSKQNIELKLDDLKQYIISKDDYAFDLLVIAIYVYIADRRTHRGDFHSVFDPTWNQEFEFHIPVSKTRFWKQKKIREHIEEMFQFAVGHSYKFVFVKDEGKNKQVFIEDIHDNQVEQLKCDCISLFSGGLDSLASTLDLLLEKKKKPLLLAHETAGKLKTYRNNLFTELNQNFEELKKWELKIKSKRGEEEPKAKQESSQRSRSILYACLGIGFAKCLNIREVYFSDNGIVTFNLPSTESNKSSQLTRSTNPKLIELINSLSSKIWKTEAPQLENLLLWKTKADIVHKIIKHGYRHLVSQTSSCVKTQFISHDKPFCGECSQCFERRFAVELNSIDESEKYKFNIFKDSLDKSPIAKTHYENFFRRADFFRDNQKNLIAIYKRFPQITEYYSSSSDSNEQEFLEKVTNLYVQHAKELQKVLGDKGKLVINRDIEQNSLLDIEYRKSLYIQNPEKHFQMNNNAEVVQEEKPFTLYTEGKALYVKKGEVKISTKQLETIHTLFQVPQEYLSYSTLLDGKHSESNNAACSTAMQTQKREINREIKKTSQSQCFELIKNFSAFKNKAKWGYKIDEWFFIRIQPK